MAEKPKTRSHSERRRPLRDRVEVPTLASVRRVDILCLLMSKYLPSRILILLAASCLMWIGVLSLAFMSFMGKNVTAGWICAGALFFALAVWIVVMASEFRSAVEEKPLTARRDIDDGITSPLPRLKDMEARSVGRFCWSGRRFLPVSGRPVPRRLVRAERPAA